MDFPMHRCPFDVPVTVAFAPIAEMAPIVPTMKYWKTLLVVSPPLDLYFLKLGILVVSLLPMPLKGLSNDEVWDTSETLRRCCVATATEARAVDGNC